GRLDCGPLIGNLGKDPELKYLDQGIAVANLRIACTESYRDRNGNNVDRTEWVSVNLWRGQAEIAGKYLRKGSTVCIEGRLSTRSWETPQGEKRSITEVEARKLILLDGRPAGGGGAFSQPVSQVTPLGESKPAAQQPQTPTAPQAPAAKPIENPVEPTEDLDDLPF
ncbi:MAG: single-stranded DNA-binding protein, partial [Bacteroidota bacterium]